MESGKISLDGVDVATVGLNDLRRAVAVIPQDPTLFQGTVRYNLDPFGASGDAEIWSALERAHLREKIAGAEGGLEAAVDAEGENFSVGERQLICLARCATGVSRIF